MLTQLLLLLLLLLLLQLQLAASIENFEERISVKEEEMKELLNARQMLAARLGDSAARDLQLELSVADPYIDLEPSTGLLRLARPIDLETLCDRASRCSGGKGQHEFHLLALRSRTTVARIRFVLTVGDINDHSPTFRVKEVEKRRDEYTCLVVGVICQNPKIDLPVAIDADFSQQFNRMEYTFKEDTLSAEMRATFDLRVDDFSTPYLQIKRGLDAERCQLYTFVLLATDAGGRSGSVSVRLIISDDNDNSPEFPSNTVNVTVSENLPVGSAVVTMRAIDKDVNHSLNYSMDPSSSEWAKFYLTVHRNGTVFVKEPLDYEFQSSLSMMVKVSDGKFDKKALLKVFLINENDNPPSYEPNSVLQIQESSPNAMQLIGSVTVKDKDTHSGENVTCDTRSKHLDRNARLKFMQAAGSSSTYQIYSSQVFDRERTPFVTGTLVCSDHGEPSLTSTFTATVTVMDINDNAPQFEGVGLDGVIHARVKENRPANELTLQLRASDRDFGDNARLSFRLVSDAGHFSVDADSGHLRTTRRLDREAKDRFQLRVEVADAGRPSLTSTAVVQVAVLDVNDNAPSFVGETSFSIAENVAGTAFVGQLAAVDRDLDQNGQTQFKLLNNRDKANFQLHSNGTLLAIRPLDRELQAKHRLSVRAFDLGSPPQHTDITVLVAVRDVNDNEPVIVQPARNDTRPVRISIYTHHTGSIVMQVQATDADAGLNGMITYSLDTDLPPKFAIDSVTGDLRVVDQLQFGDISTHKLLVMAADRGHPRTRSDARVLYIAVDDSEPPPSEQLNDAELAAAHTRRNVIIIVILAAVSAVLAIILIIAITCVNRPCCGAFTPQRARGIKLPPSDSCDRQQQQQYLEQALHLTVGDADLGGWAAGPVDRRSPCGSQSPIVTTSFATPTRDCFYGDRVRFATNTSCSGNMNGNGCHSNNGNNGCNTLPNPRCVVKPSANSNAAAAAAAASGVKVGGKSDQVNFWLYQIKEDSSAAPQASSNFCTIGRTQQAGQSYGYHGPQQQQQQQQQQQHADTGDGGQSDSGRGCSDEDLSCGPVYYQPAAAAAASQACQLHRNAGSRYTPQCYSDQSRQFGRTTPQLPAMQNAAAAASIPAAAAAAAATPPPTQLSRAEEEEEEEGEQRESTTTAAAAPLTCRQMETLLFKDLRV